jgi:hypothetical protein
MTTEQQKAHELIEKFNDLIPMESSFNDTAEDAIRKMNNDFEASKQCAIICVDEVILSNPHSNPFNTELYSTMEFWQTVRKEIVNYKI